MAPSYNWKFIMTNFEFAIILTREQASVVLQALEFYEEREDQLGRKEKAAQAEEIWNIVFDSGIQAAENRGE
jgi:hypothetical protein